LERDERRSIERVRAHLPYADDDRTAQDVNGESMAAHVDPFKSREGVLDVRLTARNAELGMAARAM
jgi:hypothetical protein